MISSVFSEFPKKGEGSKLAYLYEAKNSAVDIHVLAREVYSIVGSVYPMKYLIDLLDAFR
jgi:hypothetical protein